MPVVRTVCGDIPAESLGVCYPHEHILGMPPNPAEDPDFRLDSEQAALRELGWFHAAGGRAIVEMSPADYGRNAQGLRRLSQATGVSIICTTGNHKQKFAAPFVRDAGVDELAARYVRDLTVGIDGSDVRAGVIKAGSSLDQMTALEEKVFRAAARAHRASGAPISTHTEAGTMALEQLDLLCGEGVDAGHIIIGHLDRRLDRQYLTSVAASGAYLGFDQVGKEKYAPDRERITMIRHLVEAGYGRQILLSGDQARRSSWPSYGGGPGLTYILWRFVPWLREEHFDAATIELLLVENPARALALADTHSLVGV